MIARIDHIVITTANIDACVDFYQQLGFVAKNAGGRWEFFAGDFKINVHMKGHELEPKAHHVQPGSSDFCLETDEPLAVWKERLTQRNIPLEVDEVPRTGAHGNMRSIYLRDPDGNLVELCRYK